MAMETHQQRHCLLTACLCLIFCCFQVGEFFPTGPACRVSPSCRGRDLSPGVRLRPGEPRLRGALRVQAGRRLRAPHEAAPLGPARFWRVLVATLGRGPVFFFFVVFIILVSQSRPICFFVGKPASQLSSHWVYPRRNTPVSKQV